MEELLYSTSEDRLLERLGSAECIASWYNELVTAAAEVVDIDAEQAKPLAVRPIQSGELLRKIINRRLIRADKEVITRRMLQARQWGNGRAAAWWCRNA